MDTAAAQSIPVPESTKVCIVCSYCYSDKAVPSFAVMIADVQPEAGGDASDESVISIRPTFLIDGISFDDGLYNFCVLNSTLYMIEMGIHTIDHSLGGKSVYTYDLSRYLKDGGSNGGSGVCVDGEILYKDDMVAAPEMLYPKYLPFVTPTPDGKRIVVFSSTINMSFLNEDPNTGAPNAVDEDIDFEVYDPQNKAWRKLPSLRDYQLRTGSYYPDIEIQGFTFLTSSDMLFQMSEGIFVIDINMPEIGWHKQDSYLGAKRIPFEDRFFVIEDDKIQLCLDTSRAYDISPWAKTKYKEHLFDSSMASRFPTSYIALDANVGFGVRHSFRTDVAYDEDDLLVVHLQTALDMYTQIAYMLLDVSRYNLKKYKDDDMTKKKNKKKKKKEVVEGEDLEKKSFLNASSVDSFKFKLDTEPCWSFIPHCVSIIRA
ncbi:Unknown protein [Striga hermonthica]|uniref:Uncharacterized protein n=1 Tax=Striga hermonthica TaxID=68872 RepID=A0A9N7N2P1_STRHE|nr:Unknown protein [Striga hermonthica]